MPHIEADTNRMRQLLINLVKNALEAMENQTNGKLVLSTECAKQAACHYVEIKITDNGPGIPQDMFSSLFEPYITSKPKGSGLGLAIVKKIVEEHGGVLWAENNKIQNNKIQNSTSSSIPSNQANSGATLYIRLPVVSAVHKTTETSSAQPKLMNKGKNDAAA